MRLLGNVIWLFFGGFVASLIWTFFGVILTLTIIGIPLATQCFKFAELVLTHFSKDVRLNINKRPIANVIWAILFGWGMALFYLAIALVFAITIIGLPFAIQWSKLSKLALFPFGARVR